MVLMVDDLKYIEYYIYFQYAKYQHKYLEKINKLKIRKILELIHCCKNINISNNKKKSINCIKTILFS